MDWHGNDLRLFTGTGSQDLAASVAAKLGRELSPAIVGRWPSGDCRVQLQETVRGDDVYIIQSFGGAVNDLLMELLIMLDAARRASAGRLTAVVPFYPYSKQEQKFRGREPISARLVADLLVAAGADRVLTVDLHEGAIQGFFNIPVDHLSWLRLAAEALREEGLGADGTVVVAPDEGAVERAVALSGMLGTDIAIVFKRHPEASPEGVETVEIVGRVKNRRAIIPDDFILGGSTLCNAARELSDRGATEIYAAITHPVLCGDAVRRINDSNLEKLLVSDTIPLGPEKRSPKIRVVSIASMLAEAVRRIHEGDSLSEFIHAAGGPPGGAGASPD
jgi:ribose-phosphate pyrophosphokinase